MPNFTNSSNPTSDQPGNSAKRWSWVGLEKSLLFKDRLFYASDWDRHVTKIRYAPEFVNICRAVIDLSPLLLWIAVVTLSVCLYDFYKDPTDPDPVNAQFLGVFTLTSFALALLLVFRTNSAYSRWYEARQMCDAIRNACQNILRLAHTYIPDDNLKSRAAIIGWTACILPATVSQAALEPKMFRDLCSRILTASELQWLTHCATTPAVAILNIISKLVADLKLHPLEQSNFEQLLHLIDNNIGGCDKLSTSPIPLAYTRHTSRFLILFLFFLPFAMVDFLKWWAIPAMMIITFLLSGVENIGVAIENPFRVLPLYQLAEQCRDGVLQLAEERKILDQIAVSSLKSWGDRDLRNGSVEEDTRAA